MTRKLGDFFQRNGFILAEIAQHVKRILGKRHFPHLIQNRNLEAVGVVISVELQAGRGTSSNRDSISLQFLSPTLTSNGPCPIHFRPLKTLRKILDLGKKNSLLFSIPEFTIIVILNQAYEFIRNAALGPCREILKEYLSLGPSVHVWNLSWVILRFF